MGWSSKGSKQARIFPPLFDFSANFISGVKSRNEGANRGGGSLFSHYKIPPPPQKKEKFPHFLRLFFKIEFMDTSRRRRRGAHRGGCGGGERESHGFQKLLLLLQLHNAAQPADWTEFVRPDRFTWQGESLQFFNSHVSSFLPTAPSASAKDSDGWYSSP